MLNYHVVVVVVVIIIMYYYYLYFYSLSMPFIQCTVNSLQGLIDYLLICRSFDHELVSHIIQY